MDLFVVSPLPAALPMAFTCAEQNPPPAADESSQHPFIFHEVSPGEPGIRETTKQQWEFLRPLIQRIYIDENRPFPYLAKILREEHGFQPTKRQFSRQIEKWGFKKNVSRSERRVILQSLPGNMNDPVPKLPDRRVRPGKLKNWRRRYREEVDEKSVVLPQEPGNQRVGLAASRGFPIADAEFSIVEAEIRQELAPGEPPAASGVCQNFDNAVKQAGLDLGDGALLDICQDYWPFDWSKVNIPGSPGLSRLFRGLELESASHIPPISLDEPEADDPPCLSKSELQDLVYGSKETSNASFHPARASRVQRYSTSTALEKSSAGRDPQYPWRNIEGVFCGYATSPLTEIYVFPSTFPPDHSRKPFHPVMPLRSEFQRRETELKAKFGKLKKRLPADNPAVVAVMEDLAFVFFELDKFNKAESMYRKLVNLYRLTLGPNHATTLEACQKVIESLRQQGQYSKAKSLNDTLRSATSKLVQAHHPLAIRIAMNDAWLSELLGQNEEAERVRREILQIMLTHYGPRHFISMYALSVLGYSISTRGGEDGEKLLRTALQLSLEDPDGEPSYYTTICTILDLASALQAKGAYEESLSISTNAVERFTPLLGSTHPLIRGLNERRAWSLLRTGILVESEKLFRDLVAFYSVGKVETRGTDLANAWFGFANVLSKMGRLGDAIGWYEKCFQFSVTSYGANHKESIALCYQFADCYEEQGRFDDALSVFRQMIHKLRASGQDSEDAILDLGSEIERIEQKMEQEASFSSNSDREGSEYESDSDDKNLNKETSERENEKVDERHVDATKGEGEAEEGQSEPEDDDWKSFLHDDFRTL